MNIVFYDDDCGLCQKLIQFLYRADKFEMFHFAPLGGKSYRQIYGDGPLTFSTLKLYYNNKTYEKSAAILKLCLLLGGGYKFFYIFIIVPAFIRDALYDWVASHRKKICDLNLSDKNRDGRFLD